MNRGRTSRKPYAYERVFDEIEQAREYGEVKWAEGKAEGETAGQARAILALLAARGISVSTEVRAQIEECKDPATLDRWIVRAATASSAEEVIFAPSECA